MGWTFVEGKSNVSNSGSTPNVTLDAAPTDGDLVVFIVHANNASNTITEDTGTGAAFSAAFDSINVASETATYSVLWKTANSEPLAYTSTLATSSRWSAIVLVFAPGSGTLAVDASTSGRDGSGSTTATIPGITLVSSETVSIVIAMMDRNTTGSPSPDNSYIGTVNAVNQKLVTAYRINTSSGATGTTTITSMGNSDNNYYVHISFEHGGGSGGISIPVVMHHLNQMRN